MEVGRARLDSLTGLRAVAALVVFASHIRWLLPTDPLITVAGHEVSARAFMQQGNVGVSFFFILSGFVLAWTARPGDRAGPFYGRRFARIYPLHLVTAAIWMALATAGLLNSAAPSTGAAVATVLLVQDWVPSEAVFYGLNPPSWSLSCEVFFYALFPFLLPRVLRLRDEHLGMVVGGLVAAAIAVPTILFALQDRIGYDTAYYLGYVFPPTRLLEFVLGMVLGVACARGRWRSLRQWWPGLLGLGAYLVAGRTPRVMVGVAVTVIPFVFMILAAAGSDLAGRRSIWRSRLMIHLGEVSFAFYLTQHFVVDLLLRARPDGVGTTGGGAAWALVALVASLAVAEVLRTVVERPAERFLRRRLGGTSVPRANAAMAS